MNQWYWQEKEHPVNGIIPFRICTNFSLLIPLHYNFQDLHLRFPYISERIFL